MIRGPIAIIPGDDFDQVIEWRQDTENGPPVDMTGFTVQWKFTKEDSSSFLVNAAPRIVVDGPNGKITVNLTPTQTQVLGDGRWSHKLSVTTPKVTTLFAGAVIVSGR